jgi:signal transduction histidine kinase/CHASE3 domain sensor protein
LRRAPRRQVTSIVRHGGAASWRILSPALVPFLVATLLLSVIVPALEMRRVMRLLREITEVIEPARAVSWKVESDLLIEYSALQGFALTGDSAFLSSYQSKVDDEAHHLATLESLAVRIGPAAAEDAAALRGQIAEWQQLNLKLFNGHTSGAQFAQAARIQRERRDSIIKETDRLPSLLSVEAARRLEQVPGHERQSLFVNAVLVIVALAAIAAVISLSRRERRMAAVLHEQAMFATALRVAAEALAGAFTVEDVSQQIAVSALDATQARGAFVENIVAGSDGSPMLLVRGAAGIDVPHVGVIRPYAGSVTEQAFNNEAAAIVADLSTANPSGSGLMRATEPSPTIVLPVMHSQRPIGALFIVGAGPARFRAEDTDSAHTIAHLAALAYEKVRLLDEAREGRHELERVMKSRQRLMRGFSHDVKNPLGAADGYADLLGTGIYGDLTVEQTETVKRIRRSIRRALELIDDLHELARAETGNIALRRESVDVAELVRSSGDEYRGAAYASGLPLTVDVADGIAIVQTDGVRVRQIIGNLLSNAIKYTTTGAITVRVRQHSASTTEKIPSSVDIEVIDTGRGIPADKLEYIFDEFSRLDTTDKPGAGLGLAISKRLAEAMHGEITVSSEVGLGSRFTLRIPATVPGESTSTAWQTVDDVHIGLRTASTEKWIG